MPRTPRVIAILAGALAIFVAAGCPTVDLGDDPPDPALCRPSFVYFRDVLWTQYIDTDNAATSCVDQAGCHSQANGRSSLRLDVDDPIDFDGNYNVVTRFLNCGVPEQSVMHTRPLAGIDEHGGGDLFNAASAESTVFLDWFNQ